VPGTSQILHIFVGVAVAELATDTVPDTGLLTTPKLLFTQQKINYQYW